MPPSTIRDFGAWTRHRHTGTSLAARGSGFQHSFKSLLPRNIYGKEHPEYYALVSPERWVGDPKPTKPTRVSDPMMTGSWQLCTSNPEVRKIIADNLIAKNTEAIQSISPNDGYGFCECDACRAQDPEGQGIVGKSYNITDRMYDFLSDNALALGILRLACIALAEAVTVVWGDRPDNIRPGRDEFLGNQAAHLRV